MRVIAGKYRSRPLAAPPGLDTRPTADRLRETLFNILTQGAVDHIAGSVFLDLYAGSGAVGIEALSRGAASVTFVEQDAAPLAVLRSNLDYLGIRGPNVQIEKKSVVRCMRAFLEKGVQERFGVVFLDPPYAEVDEYSQTLGLLGSEASSLLAESAVVVAEHRRKEPLAEAYGSLTRFRIKEQGDAALSFYQVKPQEISSSGSTST